MTFESEPEALSARPHTPFIYDPRLMAEYLHGTPP